MNKIKQWVKLAPKPYLDKVAKNAGTTRGYIAYTLANNTRVPRIDLALRIQEEMNKVQAEVYREHNIVLPVIHLKDFVNK